LQSSFQKFFETRKLLHSPLLLAVSGGLDSVVLTNLSVLTKLDVRIAHCNFKLRGAESDRDQLFVEQLARQYNVPIFTRSFNTQEYAEENRMSVQEAARVLRYTYFAELCRQHNLKHTVLAHHADDAIETLLMNFFRGTGLQGLTSIAEEVETTSPVLRPLLSKRRAELEAWAHAHQLQWVEDSSNASADYTRNYLRLELIPALKKIYPSVEQNLLANIQRFSSINQFYQEQVNRSIESIRTEAGSETRFPVLRLKQLAGTPVLYEILKRYHFTEKQVQELEKLLDAESGRYFQNEQYQVIRHRRWIIIAPKTAESGTIAISEGDEQVVFDGCVMTISSKVASAIDPSSMVAQFDASQIRYPLLLRKWKQGDYFYPLGLRKKKKVARFLIDQKIPKNRKENTWVVESGKRIIWVVGLRIDDRFKIMPNTQHQLQLSISSLSFPGKS
jgi:tRNA(Ile)-lysidine synthase